MEAIFSFLSNPVVRDVGAGAIVVLVVTLIITGRLIPLRTHTREMTEVQTSRDAWKTAHGTSEVARQALQTENFKQSETIRYLTPPARATEPSGGA